MLTADELDKLFKTLEVTKHNLNDPSAEPGMIDPAEAAVAAHFSRNATPILDRPQLLLQEFQKYRNLIERPAIRRALVSEREALLSLLRDYLKKLEASVDRVESGQNGGDSDDEEDRFRGDNNRSGTGGHNRAKLLSPRLAGIVLLRQMCARITTMLATSQGILNDLDGFPRFAQQCQSLVGRIKGEEDSRFEGWLSEVQQKIDDEDSSLKLQGSLMGWKDGVLVVNFSEDLVRFLREVRQLDEMGFDIPRMGKKKGIMDKAQEAEKYYRYGILLKKTANFYNSISEQMIDVQEQLLLESLNAFASVVSKPSLTRSDGDISWSNPAECENYIRMLQEAAEKLSSENRWLRKIHESLCAQTVQLMGIDLLKQSEGWKLKWRGIKEKLITVRSKYSEKDSRMWTLHWDNQIYKALECTYQMGLESLNENLSEIKVDLVFSNKRLEFKPPLEQIRQSYYSEMKKFIAMPNSFEGFGNASVYKRMGPCNSRRLMQVFTKAELLMDKLSGLLTRYAGWGRLGQVDLDLFVESNVTDPEAFLLNFKSLRAKRKDIDRLPDQEKVDCCTVSLAPFKGFLEDLFHRVGDTLLVVLRRGLLQQFKEVDTFLEFSNERLSTRPHSIAEIGAAKRQWKEIDDKKDSMKSSSMECVEKKKILLQYAPGTAIDTTEVSSRMSNLDGEGGRWDDFDIALEAFNDMVEEQKEALKGTLEDDVTALNMSIDKFGNRWKQLKPSDVKSWEYSDIQKIFDTLGDWKRQFADLELSSTTLKENCVTFGLQKPRFDGLENLMEDFKNTNKSWDLLRDYYDELNIMNEQDWLTFSVNVYVLQDFAIKWSDMLKAAFTKGSYDSVAEHISSTVEKIKKAIPALKYCQGEPFKEDHWTELLQGRLQLSREVKRDNVKVSHFLSRLDILMEPTMLSFVKNLQARAMGEVQIREALQELRGWERTAEIKLLSQDESGRKVPLIKDWKDLFLEMGDKQSLLASLKESQFFKAFADQGLALESKMSTLDFVLHTLNSIQRKWVYLEPIFGRGALPSEEGRFRRINETFTDIMSSVARDPKLFYLADEQMHPHLSDTLRTMLDQLERCQKALTDFLEAKRSSMPRFYFIGDDDLLEILGQAKNPNVIQSHLKKLFQGIHRVQFNKDSTAIVAMVSSAGEVVEFQSAVPVNERVEDWLEHLAVEMRNTLAALLTKCLQAKAFSWAFPSQILCLAQAIEFTENAETAVKEGTLGALHSELTETLKGFTSHDLSSEPLMQLKMKSLVFDMVHYIDVVEQLQGKGVVKLNEWQWKKQLRYYYEKSKAVVRMHDARFDYSYEYQGNAPKLVHTPLTDKCYLTLTQGMHMGFGGNPYGPAGTGKTESVKALAACMGRQVLVFNCDEALERCASVCMCLYAYVCVFECVCLPARA
jgi:dynein heavy chain 2, cytosolic